jgi:hypothetical protein
MEPDWHKSSYSNSFSNCVEVKEDPFDGWRLVRDSKDPGGPVLAVPPLAWQQFVNRVKARTAQGLWLG